MNFKSRAHKCLKLSKKIIYRTLKKIDNVRHKFLDLCHYCVKLIFKSRKVNTFSIVTATYNSEKYLEKYFSSIFNNTYTQSKIEIIIVDDGSKDNTKKVVEKWVNKNEINVIYLYQENQGQSIARNKGLEYAKNDWVTFIDSDDFISENYFKEINFAINLTKEKSIISTRWINYYENLNEYKDNHPLTYRFNGFGKVQLKNMIKNPMAIQLSMNSVFFKKSEIYKYNIKLQDIKPQFEDAVFLMDYVRNTNNYNIAFTKKAIYYYRKRSDNSSTLNKASTDTRKYVELLKEAYLKVLEDYKSVNRVIPKFVQNTIIYDLSWNIKELENNKVSLNVEQRQKREEYLKQIFNYIEFNNIVQNWKYLWKMYQIGINYKYYNGEGKVKQGIYLHYQTNTYYKYLLIDVEDKWKIYLNNKHYELNDLESKKKEESLNDEFFVNKRYIKISKYFDNVKIYYEGVSQVVPKESKKEVSFNKDSLIIFYDRKNKADDNAEVMYEWMGENHPEFNKMYFALEKDSKDYKRLEDKGFKLIDYGTKEFENMYIKADYIMSSALDVSIENYNYLRYNIRGIKRSEAKFIFLQHGIITDDLSTWIDSKRIDKIISSADYEYCNLINKYNLFKEEVILSGLPRYDKLYNNPKNEILIQFTWRMQYKDYKIDKIQETNYFKNIIKLLTDEKLQKKIQEKGYIIKFVPHPEINKYIKNIKKIENSIVKICDVTEVSFRDLFATAKLMVTDYSSVFTDFAYLNKPVIYYQYDKEEFYQGHLYTSEMDYENDGLGSVQSTHENLIDKILYYIDNDCSIEEKYLERINKFFKFKDQNNCKRLFDELNKTVYEVDVQNNYLHIEVLKEQKEEKIIGNIFIFINNKRLYTISVHSVREKVYYYNIVIPKEKLQGKKIMS